MYYSVIGLEIHIELDTKSKMFCSCKNDADEKEPNKNTCPICLGHPGTLPVANEEAIKKVLKTGLALGCKISERSWFDRKNYFYPDLPKGYQISQHFSPFCKEGLLEIKGIDVEEDNPSAAKKIRIKEVHLEEDTCRLLHFKDYSLIDCNRSGMPLMELVTEPDLDSGQETRRFTQELQSILRYLNVSGADMEKGQMRIEANVSISKEKGKLGTKVELKNINSFRAVEKAINYEIERQEKVLEQGEQVLQETRGWNDKTNRTVLQREKETAHDYRYFPEPDLPPFVFEKDYLQKIKTEIGELPSQKRERLAREYYLLENEVEALVQNRGASEFFEKVISELPPRLLQEDLKRLIKLSFNYINTDLLGILKGKPILTKDFLITPKNFAEFIVMIFEGKLLSKTAKDVLKEMFDAGGDPSQILESKGLSQITDDSEIKQIVEKVISENPKPVQDYKAGKETTIQFLIGKVMAASKGKTNPEIVKKLLKDLLS